MFTLFFALQVITILFLFATRKKTRRQNARMRRALSQWMRAGNAI